MRQVSKDEFFTALRAEKRDVHPSIVNGTYPYTSNWQFQREMSRGLFGKSVGRIEAGTSVNDYFLAT
jgi:hypothetical protein